MLKRLLTGLTFFFIQNVLCVAQQVISLAGAWDFRMGDAESGQNAVPTAYDDYVILPGSMLTNGKGNPVSVNTQWTGSLYDSSFYFNPYMEKYKQEGNMKFPFFLTPEKHYVGNAWYRRSVYVPKGWKNRRITLFLERPHIETTVFVNGVEVGHQTSLSVPHRYDVTKLLKLGEANEIAIRVYNGIENVCVGQDSHSVTDQTQGNWNGIVGRIELQSQWKDLYIDRVRIYPDAVAKQVRVKVELKNNLSAARGKSDALVYWVTGTVCSNSGQQLLRSQSVKAEGKEVELVIDLGDNAQLWDEFTPYLYQLTVEAGEDVYEAMFGLRNIAVNGRQLTINGRPLFMRGTVENCCFPQTGYPPTDKDEWIRVFKKCKEYGINHIRFHSYCPPEAAFAAADEQGLYLQAEGPSWPNHGVKLRRGMKIDQYLLEESKRIVDEYGHHPSFVMMAAGNEPAGDWVKTMKEYDSTKIYAGASVGGGWAWDNGAEFHVKAGARGLDWDKQAPHSDDDYFQQLLFPRNYKSQQPNNSPILAHEQGQWCAFPDFKEIAQYTGAYKAKNFEIFQDLLRDHGMASQAERFLIASGRLQVLCYKYEIERNLRTKDYSGFQLLGLNDYSGQGTALVGPLNVYWREKGYCTAKEWQEFCSPVVLLARFPRFVYLNSDTLQVPVEAYNAYNNQITGANVTYTITADGNSMVASGNLSRHSIPVGKNTELGKVVFPLQTIDKPVKLTLMVSMGNLSQNHWDFWVYPQQLPQIDAASAGIYETDTLDDKALKVLKKGGTVLITAGGKVRYGNDVRHSWLPVFWNTSWFKMRPPHTTGAYIEQTHPLFRDFPTDDWQNLNWWELTNRTQVMNLAEFPADYQPVVQPIDTWHVSRKLGMLIEARVLKGRLLMTTMDIRRNLAHRPVARQLRYSILRYMQSADFQPSICVPVETISHLFEHEAPKVDMFTNDSPDELKPKIGS